MHDAHVSPVGAEIVLAVSPLAANEPLPASPPLDVVARRLDASIEWMLRGRVIGECIGVADMVAMRELLRQHGH